MNPHYDAWTHFNDKVRNKMEGEYGEFTNADFHAATALYRENAALRAKLRDRDELWCKTLIASLDVDTMQKVLNKFSELRAALDEGGTG